MTISGTNCTCVNSSGTAITSAKHGDVIYITVGNNNHNTGTRTVSINAKVSGCSTYTTSASWTQDKDSCYTCYNYTTTLTTSSGTAACAANSGVTVTPKCSYTRLEY